MPARVRKSSLEELAGAARGKLPTFVDPELATLVERPPEGDGFLHEMKLDGYRIMARLESGSVQMLTRRGLDWSSRMPSLARLIQKLPARSAMIDGEIVVLRSDGTSNFQELQNSLTDGGDARCNYFVFDLLYLDGFDLRAVPLEARKQRLRQLVRDAQSAARSRALKEELETRLRYSEHVIGNGLPFYQSACAHGLEGIVSKRRDAPYRSGRARDWLKAKCIVRQEFVIGGFTEPSGTRSYFGALLVGAHDENGKLRYRGKVGTGFTQRSLKRVHTALSSLTRDRPAFVDAPRGSEARDVHWVEPKLVAEIAYTEITGDGMLRHPSFQGLREDKPAEQVEEERPAPMEATRQPRLPKAAVARAKLRLTHPERVLYPDARITKRELAEYYLAVAELMLPHVANRPLSLVRCPEGVEAICFYQKAPMPGMPRAIRPIPIPLKESTTEHTAIDDVEGLLALVQMSVVEIHPWGTRADRPDRPDRLIFDLDPAADVGWPKVVETARLVRDVLAELGLTSFVKSTGGKGLHVVVPVERRLDWDTTKEFCRSVAALFERVAPNQYVTTMSKTKRRGRVFIDYLRNDYGATAVAAYSTRARPGAPVSAPLRWDELGPDPTTQSFTLRSMLERVRSLGSDPWSGFFDLGQAITSDIRRRVRS